jgi:hypothetical protein
VPSQALYEKPIPVMEPPSPPDPIPVTTTEKITAAAKLAALLAKEILGKEMQSDAVRCSAFIFVGVVGFGISSVRVRNGSQWLICFETRMPHSRRRSRFCWFSWRLCTAHHPNHRSLEENLETQKKERHTT